MLHVTNGDAAAERIRASGAEGTVLPWRDVLHEGPVPRGHDAAALREIRAAYLARDRSARRDAILQQLGQRDATLDAAAHFDEVVLWFEHDLYDQLQLIQILDRLDRQDERAPSLICIDRFPGIPRFRGLGQLSAAQIGDLLPTRRSVSARQRRLAREAWAAFSDPDPRAIAALLRSDPSELPFLAPALQRHLAQFPSTRNGLGRTEQQALGAAAAGAGTAGQLFRSDREAEEAPFLGDSIFYDYLSALSDGAAPLLEVDRQAGNVVAGSAVRVTRNGRRVLDGEADRVRLGGLDRWFGGVHLVGREAAWRYEPTLGELRAS